jgi:glucose dehydrogenase
VGLLLLLCSLGVVAGVLALRRRPARVPSPAITPVTDSILLAAGSATDSWLTYGRDYSNQRYDPVAQINRATVAGLAPVWSYKPDRLFQSRNRNEATPLVVDGALIYTDPNDLVIALDAATGNELWQHSYKPGPAALCCGFVNRGVAVFGDKVFVGTSDARLLALDRRTGSTVWDRPIASPTDGYSVTMAPLAVSGKIVIGVSGGEFGVRGFLDAYDPTSGDRIWRFWTIPSPEEGGWWGRWSLTTPEGDSLPRDIAQERRDSARFADAWRHGGAPVWTNPAYDPERGTLYFGTGNPSSRDGTITPGDNLFATSLVALDVSTGRIKWYYQMVPHDIWGFDAAAPVVLFDARSGDSEVPAAAQAGKTGWVYLLDRRTGERLHRSDPFVPLEHPFPAPTLEGVRSSPGSRGGANWPPNAYSPRTRLLYVLGSYMPMLFVLDSSALVKNPRRAKQRMLTRFSHLPDDPYGLVSAIDVDSGKLVWQHRVEEHLTYGGALATGGDLVFFGEKSGHLTALDAKTGVTLWRYQVDGDVLGPPISFSVAGEQRVAVVTRHGVVTFGLPSRRRSRRLGPATPPGTAGERAAPAPGE